MLLPFSQLLTQTSPFDPECAALADRHYSRRKKSLGKKQFSTCTRRIILRDHSGLVLFVWSFPDSSKRYDTQTGYNCAIFRNESSRLSSEIILEAERFAIAEWGPARAYTFVDSRKIRSVHPGFCFLMAGWSYQRDEQGKPLLTASGKHILTKALA